MYSIYKVQKHKQKDQRLSLWGLLSTVAFDWVPGIELGSSGLHGKCLYSEAVLPAQNASVLKSNIHSLLRVEAEKKKIQRMFLNILRFHAFQSKCNTVHLDERRGKGKLKQWQRDQCKKACLPGAGYSHVNGRHQKGLWEAKLIKVVFS